MKICVCMCIFIFIYIIAAMMASISLVVQKINSSMLGRHLMIAQNLEETGMIIGLVSKVILLMFKISNYVTYFKEGC